MRGGASVLVAKPAALASAIDTIALSIKIPFIWLVLDCLASWICETEALRVEGARVLFSPPVSPSLVSQGDTILLISYMCSHERIERRERERERRRREREREIITQRREDTYLC